MIRDYPHRMGPTWVEIVASLACSMLIATDVLFGRNSNLPQSAESYYFAYPQVQTFHTLDIAANISFLVLTLFWIVFPVTGKGVKVALLFAAFIGLALCWAEIIWAANLRTGPIFSLRDLPFRPVGNSGIIGAQVFASYMLLKLPSGKIPVWSAVVLKLGLALCFWFLQFLVWDGVKRLTGSGA